MKAALFFHSLLALLTLPAAVHAEPLRILVRRVEAVDVRADVARRVEDSIVFELGRRKTVEVVSPAEMEQTLELAKMQSELGCDVLDQCMVEVRRKLRAQQMITAKVTGFHPEKYFEAPKEAQKVPDVKF